MRLGTLDGMQEEDILRQREKDNLDYFIQEVGEDYIYHGEFLHGYKIYKKDRDVVHYNPQSKIWYRPLKEKQE